MLLIPATEVNIISDFVILDSQELILDTMELLIKVVLSTLVLNEPETVTEAVTEAVAEAVAEAVSVLFIGVVIAVLFQWLAMAVVELRPDEVLVLAGADVNTVLFVNPEVAVVFHCPPVVAETLAYMLVLTEELVKTVAELLKYTVVGLEVFVSVRLALFDFCNVLIEVCG